MCLYDGLVASRRCFNVEWGGGRGSPFTLSYKSHIGIVCVVPKDMVF